MGFFDLIGNIFETVAEPVLNVGLKNPLGAVMSVSKQGKPPPVLENSRSTGMFNDFTESQMGTLQRNVSTGGVNGGNGFFGNIGSTIRGFGQDVGGFLNDIRPAADIFGINIPGGGNAPGGAQTIIRQRPDESSSSGEILGANLGMAPALFQAGRNFLRTPGGQTALGFGAGALGAALSGGGNGAPRITRKMKSDVRRIYMMAGMDPNATAQILNNLGTYPRMNFNASLVFFILTKRFRNDGPVVTKAAVRKTRTTLRRMKGIVDLHNSICKPTTRRAPMRRAAPKAVQLIKN